MKHKFNKSEVMKSSYRIYRNSLCTMSEALKEYCVLQISHKKKWEA